MWEEWVGERIEQSEWPWPVGVSGEELVYEFANGMGEKGSVQIRIR